MKKLFLFALLVLIAACSSQPEADTPSSNPNLTRVSLALDFGLSTLGVPFQEDGTPVVESLEITILDSDGNPLTFDEDYNLDPSGSVAFIPYTPGDDVSVGIVAGQEYTFQAKGFDGAGTWMSYGEVTQVVNIDTDTVALGLHTLMNAVTLDHTAPISSVVPGQLLDLYLSVTSPSGYEVPFEDYSAVYEVGADDGNVNEQSDLGTRVTATTNPQDNDFTVTVTVIGWMIVDGVATENQQMTSEFTLPFVENAGFFLDNERPSLTVNDPGSLVAGQETTLTGTASDNIGIQKVQVFEGPVLIGSSDTEEYAEEGVAEVSFTGNDWSMSWTPEEGDYDLTVVAIDTSGNQTEVEQGASVAAFSAVVTNGNNDGAGSLRQVVADAQAGDIIGFAEDVQTVVLSGERIIVDKNLTIVGSVTIDGGAYSNIFYIAGGANVILEDLTITNGFVTGNSGGGLYSDGSLTLRGNTTVTGNETTNDGGGVYLRDNGTLTLQDNATITGNSSSRNGGGVFLRNNAVLTLQDNAIISDNTAAAGGGVYRINAVTLNGLDYAGNDVGNDGMYNVFGNTPDQVR